MYTVIVKMPCTKQISNTGLYTGIRHRDRDRSQDGIISTDVPVELYRYGTGIYRPGSTGTSVELNRPGVETFLV